MPSLRALMRQHGISLSTALQLSRQLESEGWLEARPRSGYFVRRPRRHTLASVSEPRMDVTPDPAQYAGIHARVSEFVARRALDQGFTVSPDDVQITHGCIEALNIALRAVAQPGDAIEQALQTLGQIVARQAN